MDWVDDDDDNDEVDEDQFHLEEGKDGGDATFFGGMIVVVHEG